MLSNAVTNAQKQIEGKNFDIRKNLKDYDDVLAKQRDIIYKKRDAILMAEDIVNLIHDFFKTCGGFLAKKAIDANSAEGLVSGEQLKKLVEPRFLPEGALNAAAYDGAPTEEAGEDLGELLYANYLEKRKTWPAADADMVERQIALHVIDHNWQSHIDTMAHLREGISLRSYAQTNPLQDYVNEGYDLFKEMNEKVAVDTAFNLLNVRLVPRGTPEPAGPSRLWWMIKPNLRSRTKGKVISNTSVSPKETSKPEVPQPRRSRLRRVSLPQPEAKSACQCPRQGQTRSEIREYMKELVELKQDAQAWANLSRQLGDSL
jgi:preprotein translocase subunit SecA